MPSGRSLGKRAVYREREYRHHVPAVTATPESERAAIQRLSMEAAEPADQQDLSIYVPRERSALMPDDLLEIAGYRAQHCFEAAQETVNLDPLWIWALVDEVYLLRQTVKQQTAIIQALRQRQPTEATDDTPPDGGARRDGAGADANSNAVDTDF